MKASRCIAVLAIAVLGVLTTSPAHASALEPTPAPGSQQFTYGNLSMVVNESEPVTAQSRAETALLAPTITCNLNVQDPHGSTHVSGTINVVARVSCGVPAARIRLQLSLFRVSPYKSWAAPTLQKDNVAVLQNNRAVSCSEGPADFRGWAAGTITPPPGYQLSGSPQYERYGNLRPVACGLAFAADTNDYSESLTFTFVRTE